MRPIMMSRCHTVLLLTAILLLSAGAAVCEDLNALYSEDYDAFWKRWHRVRKGAVLCINPKRTSSFLADTVEMLGNAEVSEANSEAVEQLAIENPACLLAALEHGSQEGRSQIVRWCLVRPSFTSPTRIEESLNGVWNEGRFSSSRAIYYAEKQSRQEPSTPFLTQKTDYIRVVDNGRRYQEFLLSELRRHTTDIRNVPDSLLYLAAYFKDPRYIKPLSELLNNPAYSQSRCIYSCPIVFSLAILGSFTQHPLPEDLDSELGPVRDLQSELKQIQSISLKPETASQYIRGPGIDDKLDHMESLPLSQVIAFADPSTKDATQRMAAAYVLAYSIVDDSFLEDLYWLAISDLPNDASKEYRYAIHRAIYRAETARMRSRRRVAAGDPGVPGRCFLMSAEDGPCRLKIDGLNYQIGTNGVITIENNQSRRRIAVDLPERFHIDSVQYTALESKIVFVFGITDNEGASALISLFDPDPCELEWVTDLHALNPSRPLFAGESIYIGGIGTVAKIDGGTGSVVWRHSGLHQRDTGTFNAFEEPTKEGDVVIFRDRKGAAKSESSGVKEIRVSDTSGEIIATAKQNGTHPAETSFP